MRRNIDDVYRINDQANQKLQAMIALLSDLKQEFVTKNAIFRYVILRHTQICYTIAF